VRHHIESLTPYLHNILADGDIPWTVVGVFATEDDVIDGPPEAWWKSFCYTSGLLVMTEMWAPCASIEGRMAGHELTAFVLNHLGAAFRAGALNVGDEVIVPLGVPDKEGDVDTIWWIGEEGPARYRQVNMSDADWVVPVMWSSPLGWPEEPTEGSTDGCVDHPRGEAGPTG